MKLRNMNDRINQALEELRPFLKSDGGDIVLVGIDEDLTVRVELLGACAQCSQAALTMKGGVEEVLRRAVPEIKSVVAINMPEVL
jgi:Fe-S cluster biogenesis protein NfuA